MGDAFSREWVDEVDDTDAEAMNDLEDRMYARFLGFDFTDAINSRLTTTFFPEDYGAVADGKHVFDGAMTSGSNSLSSTAAGFTGQDVGKSVAVYGAATGGALNTPLRTTISSVSAGVAHLASNAAATVVDATVVWGTDNTTALQACIDAAMASDSDAIIKLKTAVWNSSRFDKIHNRSGIYEGFYLVESAPRHDRHGNCILSIDDALVSHKRVAIVGNTDWNRGGDNPAPIIFTTRTEDSIFYFGTTGQPKLKTGVALNVGMTTATTDDDISAWPASGAFICEKETIRYSSKTIGTPSTLNGLTRGVYGEEANHPDTSHIYFTYGPPSVIGGRTVENGAAQGFEYTGLISILSTRVQIGGNPKLAGIDATSWGGFESSAHVRGFAHRGVGGMPAADVAATDGSISSGSAALSSTTLAFTSPTDVGAKIAVYGAGPSGGVLYTSILSVAGGVATLANNASTTVSGARVVRTRVAAPINEWTFGFRTPTGANYGFTYLRNMTAAGMYAGLIFTACDHTSLLHPHVSQCVLGIGFQVPMDRRHTIGGGYIMSEYVSTIMGGYIPSFGVIDMPTSADTQRGPAHLTNVVLDVEPSNPPADPQGIFACQTFIQDANNYIHGDITFHQNVSETNAFPGPIVGANGLEIDLVVPKGPTIAGANSFNLAGNSFVFVSGTTGIKYISQGWIGQQITLVFTGTAGIQHNQASVPSGYGAVLLNRAVNFTAGGADRTVTLIYDGTVWREIGRASPGATGTYTVTNPTTDRGLNVTADSTTQVAQVLGTLITDLQSQGLLS